MVEVALAFNAAYIGFGIKRDQKRKQLDDLRLDAMTATKDLDDVSSDYAFKNLEAFPNLYNAESPGDWGSSKSYWWFNSFFAKNQDETLSKGALLTSLLLLAFITCEAVWGSHSPISWGLSLTLYICLVVFIMIPPLMHLLWQKVDSKANGVIQGWRKHLVSTYKTKAREDVNKVETALREIIRKTSQHNVGRRS